MAHVQQMRIRGGDRLASEAGHLGGDAVRQAHRTGRPVVPPSPKPPRRGTDAGVHGQALHQTELGNVKGCFILFGADDAYEMVEHLGDAESSHQRIGFFEKLTHLGGRGFALQVGEHGVGI